jgi:hypothetical protein
MMSLFLYLAVLLVSLSSVLFGLGWLSTPEPHYATPPAQVVSHAPAAMPDKRAELSPVVPVQPAASPNAKPAVAVAPAAAPAPQAVAKTSAEPEVTPQAAPSADQANATPGTEVAAPAPAPPACDIAACERAYHTFTASDCTYQPSHGDRRLCTKGKPPRKAATADDARAQAALSQACNVARCEAAYRSFDPSDCTYQPSYGPRRLCSK